MSDNKEEIVEDAQEEIVGASSTDDVLVDSQSTQLHWETEVSEGRLPNSPKWKVFVPISYGTTGGTTTSVTPDELERSGQQTKGTPVQVAAAAEFSANIKQTNVQPFLVGLMRSKYVERGSNDRVEPRTTGGETVTGVAADGYTGTNFSSANGWVLPAGGELLVYADGFSLAVNNGRKFCTAVSATKISVAGLTAAPSDSGGRLYVVGVSLANGSQAYTSATKTLVTDTDLTAYNLAVGEWVQLVDIEEHPTDVPQFYGRIASVVTAAGKTTITFTVVSPIAGWIPANISGKELALYFANRYVNNAAPADITNCTYQIKRTLKENQVQTITGSKANTFSVSVPTGAKMETTMAFVSQKALTKDTNLITTSNEVDARNETMYNTSSDVKLISLYELDKVDSQLFADLQDITLAVDNGITARYKVGSKFSLGASRSRFSLTANGTAYFDTLLPIEAGEDNKTIGGVMIVNNESGGISFDFPGVTVAGDVGVSSGEPVTISMTNTAFKGAEGYTLRVAFFPYMENHGEDE